MNVFTGTVRTLGGAIVAGASVTVYEADGVTVASGLTKRDGSSQVSTFNADGKGVVTFGGNGSYIVRATVGGVDYDVPVQLTDRNSLLIDNGSGKLVLSGSVSSARITMQNTLNAVPSITSLSSSALPIGATLTINGSGFIGATGVQFGAGTRFNPPLAVTWTVVDDNTITAVVPAIAENGHITVLHPLGNPVSPTQFTVASTPTLDRLSPMRAGVGQHISIFGLRIGNVTGIDFNGTAATSFFAKTDRIVDVTVPAGATSGAVTITTPYGSVVSGTLAIQDAPTITGLPGSAVALGAAFTVTGTFDPPPLRVAVGGVPAHWTLTDSTHISVIAPNVIGGSGDVRVDNFAGNVTSGSSVSVTGTGVEPYDWYVASLGPGTDGTFHGDINGVVPSVPTSVYWNGTSLPREETPTNGPDLGPPFYNLRGATTFPSSGMHVDFPAASDGQTGVGGIIATFATGTAVLAYNITNANAPILTGFSPSSGPIGTRVTVSGSGFLSLGYAKCGNINCSHQIVDDNTVLVDIGQGAVTAPFTFGNISYQTAGSSDSFIVTPTAVSVSSMSESTGPIGTEVQLTCTGLRGITSNGGDIGFVDSTGAFIDLQREFCLRSDTLLNVLVPSGAANGAGHWRINGFNSPDFTVIAAQTPTITAPSGSAYIGDLLVLKGTHFNSVTSVQIDSATLQAHKWWARIDSKTIAIVLPPGTSSNATFHVTAAGGTASIASTLTISGTRPAVAITTSGNVFHDASGSTIQLRGCIDSALEDYSVQGFDPWLTADNPPYGYEANWAQLRFWGANIVRLPLNEASWLGYWCQTLDGSPINPDPTSTYRSVLSQTVQDATDVGIAVILDLHWTCPGNYLPYQQIAMMTQDNSLRFWSDIAETFGSNPGVLYELFNEPFVDTSAFPYTVDWWRAWSRGNMSAGRFNGIVNRDTGAFQDQWVAWSTAGMQQAVDAIRATGATGVCIVGGLGSCQDATGVLPNIPVDPLNQLAVAVHPYSPLAGGAMRSEPSGYAVVDAIHAAGYPIIATETGDYNSTGLIGSPFYERFYADYDTRGYSYLGWTWNAWSSDQNQLIQTFSGRPTSGWGFYYLNKIQAMAGITYTGA